MHKVWAGLAVLACVVPAAAMAQQQQPGDDTHGGGYSDTFDDNLRPDRPRQRRAEPIERRDFDEVVERMFEMADTGRDGIVTLAEFQGMIAARKDQAISERFASIDADHNRSISLDEFGRWQRGFGSSVLDADLAGGAAQVQIAEVIAAQPRGRNGRALSRLIEPLGSTVITAANTDYDSGTSLAELIAYEGKHFQAADTNGDGRLLPNELPDFGADETETADVPAAAPVPVRTSGG